MRRVAVLSVLVVLVGCKSEKLKTTETELAAAKARVAAMDGRRADLLKELNSIEGARRKASKQADETELQMSRLAGALLVLDGKPVPDALLLDEALRAKSPELGKLAAEIVQRRLPCVEEKTTDEDEEEHCTEPPLPDACDGIPPTTVQEFDWSCDRFVQHKGGPAIAVCTSPLTQQGTGAVRLAFLHEGRVIVGDWPEPGAYLYTPENEAELSVCNEENRLARCENDCDVKYGRIASSCYDDAEQAYGDTESDFVGEDENRDLAEARMAAAAAERLAREANEELEYQQCRAYCEPNSQDVEEEPVPPEHTMHFVKTLAPGVFQFENREVTQADGGYVPSQVVLNFTVYNHVLADNFETDKDDVEILEVLHQGSDLFIDKPAEDGTFMLAGLVVSNTVVNVSKLSVDGKRPPQRLPLEEACAYVTSIKKQKLIDVCTAQLAKLAAQRAKADAGVPDAGVPETDGGVDAGGAP